MTSIGPERISARLADAGIDVPAERIVTAAVATAQLVRSEYAGRRVLLVAERGSERQFADCLLVDGPPADLVVVGGPDESWTLGSARPRAACAAGRCAPDRHAGQRLVALERGPAARQRLVRARAGPRCGSAAADDRQARRRDLPQRVSHARPASGGLRHGRRRPAQRRARRSAGGDARRVRPHGQGQLVRERPAHRARRCDRSGASPTSPRWL